MTCANRFRGPLSRKGGGPLLVRGLLVLIIVAAGLEAFLAFCLGCTIFLWRMRAGLVPEETCEACNDLALRRT